MIAKTEIERLRTSFAPLPDGSRGFIGVDYQWFDRLLEEHLALRGIVEALAAIPPFYIDPYQDQRCACCEAKIGIDEHAELCAYRSAVALVGPAGERAEG